MLADYLGLAPTAIRFEYDANGKPSIAAHLLASPVHFNVSHAHGLALYAVASGAPVGVDVEEVLPFDDMHDVAEHFFSRSERAELAEVAPCDRHRAFYNCWTRKEAYLKARGVGLLTPLDSFDVSLKTGDPVTLRRDAEDAQASRRWSFAHLEPADAFVGAVAVEASRVAVSCWTWAGRSR